MPPIFMKKIFLFLFPVCMALSGHLDAQIIRVTYEEYQNDKLIEDKLSAIRVAKGLVSLSPPDAEIQYFIDYNRKQSVSMISFEGEMFRNTTSLDSLPVGIKSDRKDTLLGFPCDHMQYKYFSNTIDVYFTEKAGLQGSPFRNFIPGEKALVLKIVINDNRRLQAVSIEEVENEKPVLYPYEQSTPVDDARFEELKIRSRYITLPVYDSQQVNFDPSLPKETTRDLIDGHTYRFAHGTVVLKKIELPELAGQNPYIFLDLRCRSNGDAYDRTGSVFTILPGEKMNLLNAFNDSIAVLPFFADKSGKRYHGFRLENDFVPSVELMRFFTSFGVDHFNTKRMIHNYPWHQTAHYQQEITDLIPDGENSLWIGVFIGNYDKGGHTIDLDLKFYPSFDPDNTYEKWIQPLFNTVNLLEMAGQEYPRLFRTDTLEVEFEIPDSLSDLTLIFTTTGHGGWGGGDEFNPRMNRIWIDGKETFSIVPWRSDCARYRLYNPASGNFENGLSSSDFSRSNWCPATNTPPYLIPLSKLNPGKHAMRIAIDQGEDAGSSFNAWCISGTLIGKKSEPTPQED